MVSVRGINSHLISRLRQHLSDTALRKKYDHIYAGDAAFEGCRAKILRGDIIKEKLIGRKCYGVSMFFRIKGNIARKIGEIGQWLKEADPTLHIFPALYLSILYLRPSFTSDLADRRLGGEIKYRKKRIYYPHPNRERPILADADFGKYMQVISKTLRGLNPFEIRLSGLCASTASIFVQGFDGGMLNILRIKLIEAFGERKLQISEWQPEIVNITFARFQRTDETHSNNRERLIEIIDSLRNIEIGTLVIDKISVIEEKRTYLEESNVRGSFLLPSGNWTEEEN